MRYDAQTRFDPTAGMPCDVHGVVWMWILYLIKYRVMLPTSRYTLYIRVQMRVILYYRFNYSLAF